MSEYWKSTPKYWCKHCSAYVKDTPFERKQHETTAKHKGNLKRFLRGIQNDHERNEREKEKVKAEVERLNRVVGAGAGAGAGVGAGSGSNATAVSSSSKQPIVRRTPVASLSVADQKKQWAQLAEMGVQVPTSFRADMALPGEWQRVAEPVGEAAPDDSVNRGVRKRKFEDQEEEDQVAGLITRRGWGSTIKRYPGDEQPDLDALLSGTIVSNLKKDEGFDGSKHAIKHETGSDTKTSGDEETQLSEQHGSDKRLPKEETFTKDESLDSTTEASPTRVPEAASIPVFKKRRAKNR